LQQLLHTAGVGRSEDTVAWSLACRSDEGRGRALAQTQTRTAKPGQSWGAEFAFKLGAQGFGAAGQAGDVVADVRNYQWPRLEREHSVERRHTVRVGWGYF